MIRAIKVAFVLSACFIVAATMGGCANAEKGKDPVATAIAKLHTGMTKEKVLSVMKPVSLDYGVVHYGGTGSSCMYFQISESQQLRVEMGGFRERFRVIEIGKPEPKRPWKRYDDDEIVVAE